MFEKLSQGSDDEIIAGLLTELDRRIEAGSEAVGFYAAARPALRWMAEHEPDLFASTVRRQLDEMNR